MSFSRPPVAPKEPSSPFGRVLIDFMWQQRPPWSTGRMAYELSSQWPGQQRQVPRINVQNWIYRGRLPNIDDVLTVLAILQIPLSRLVAAYREAGQAMPPLLERQEEQRELVAGSAAGSSPAPRIYEAPKPAQDDWEYMVAQTIASMREAGISEEGIQTTVDHLRQKQSGERYMQRQVIAEHAVESSASHASPSPSPQRENRDKRVESQSRSEPGRSRRRARTEVK